MAAAAAPAQTEEQKQFALLIEALQTQMDSQVRLSVVGLMGLGLLGAAGYLLWRRR